MKPAAAPDTAAAAPPSIRQAAGRRRLQDRFLRAGREAVDERELLELLLVGDTRRRQRRGACRKPARHVRLRAPRPGGPPGPAPYRARSAGRRHRRPQGRRGPRHPHGKGGGAGQGRPALGSYDKVIEYCRALAGHREVEEFHILYLNRKNRLLADECLHKGSVSETSVYPREICIRCLEVQATAIVAVHNHPSAIPSRPRPTST